MVKDRRIMLSTSLYGGAALIQVMGQEVGVASNSIIV